MYICMYTYGTEKAQKNAKTNCDVLASSNFPRLISILWLSLKLMTHFINI